MRIDWKGAALRNDRVVRKRFDESLQIQPDLAKIVAGRTDKNRRGITAGRNGKALSNRQ
jgi:hypothetical protein